VERTGNKKKKQGKQTIGPASKTKKRLQEQRCGARGQAEVDKTGNKKQNTTWREGPEVKQRWRGQETRTRTRKTHRRAIRKAKGAEPRWRGQATRTKTRKTHRRNSKQKTKKPDGRSGSVSNCKQWALLHHADLMPHSTGAAVRCEELNRSGQGRREETTRKNTPKAEKKGQGHRAEEVKRTGDKNKKQENTP
jgi:hypothetical protein